MSDDYKQAIQEVSTDLKGLEEVCDLIAEGIHDLPVDTATKRQLARNLRDKYTDIADEYQSELEDAVRYQLVRDFYKVLENPLDSRMGQIYAVNDVNRVWTPIENRVEDRLMELEGDTDE